MTHLTRNSILVALLWLGWTAIGEPSPANDQPKSISAAQSLDRSRPQKCYQSPLALLWRNHSSLLAGLATPADKAAEKTPPTRILIVTGQDYPGHKWRLTTPVLRDALEKDPRLQVRVIEDPHFLDSAALNRYDVVVLHFMNWQQPAPGPKARANLQKLVADGKGLVIVHFACGAFQDWPEFRNLAGKVWDQKLRGHDPYGNFRVDITDMDHPITQGMTSFETIDELYTCLAGERPVVLLATACSKVDGKDYPLAFAFDYGKGRVFNTPLGHDVKALSHPMVGELLRRGCAWAAGLTPVAKSRPQTPPDM